MNKKILKGFYILFSFFCFFPYLFPNPIIETDVQPYALLLALFFFVLNVINNNLVLKIINHRYIKITLFTVLISGVVALFSLCFVSPKSVIRELCAYLSIFFVPYMILVMDEKGIQIEEGLFKAFILIWCFVGLVQVLGNKRFMFEIVSGARTSTTRGGFGLASEPSFFGIQCYYFMYIAKGFKRNKKLYYMIITVASAFFAQSAVGIIFVLSFWVQEGLDIGISIKKMALIIMAPILLYVLIDIACYYMPDSRLIHLLVNFQQGGINLLIKDGSVTGRLERITTAFHSAIQNLLLPQGFGEKYGSAWGGMLNHLGFFAIPAIIGITDEFSKFYTTTSGKMATFVFVLFLYTSTIQLSNPMLGFVLGYMMIMRKQNVKKLKNC